MMTIKHVLFSSLIILASFLPQESNASSIKVFPTDDAMAQLYDDDGISSWQQARNFQGEITREPFTSGTLDNTGNIAIRSDKGVGVYRIYRVSDVFDLSDIPESAEINSVTLKLYKTPVNNRGDIDVVVTSHVRADVSRMQKQDWTIDNFGTTEFARAVLVDNQYTDFNFSEAGIDYVKNHLGKIMTLGQLTEFDFDDIEPVGYILAAGWYEVEKEGEQYDPYLEIEYSLPHENKYPLYTQIESPYPSVEETAGWADDTMPCGTIATCGCAITSLVMAARAEGVAEGVDGKEVNPGNLNAWLKNNSGYSDGMLLWSKALDYFGVKDEVTGKIKTPLSFNDANHNVTDTDEIGTAIAGPEHVIGYSSKVSLGHYFVVSDLLDGAYYIRDPWYYETETLDDMDDNEEFVFDYNNGLSKANIITVKEPEVLTGFFEIVLASPAELRLENELHQVTGYDENGGRFEIPSASYDPQEYIGNPAEETPVEPHYAKHMMVPDAEGKYTLSVVGTGEGTYHLGISLRDSDGDEYYKRFTSSTTPGHIDEYVIDVETGEIEWSEEEDGDDEGGGEIDRDAFIALVKAATVDERKLVQKFFIFEANRLFDSIEKERAKIALIRLRVFATLLKAKHINNAPLNEAIKTLEAELKGVGR